MKAVTLHQPWATFIVLGWKLWETRGWKTTYRGPLAIHASKNPAYLDIAPRLMDAAGYGAYVVPPLVLGAVVGVATLVDCRTTNSAIHALPLSEQALGDYRGGRYAWRLRDAVACRRPLPCRGQMGLWTPPADLAAQLAAMYQRLTA